MASRLRTITRRSFVLVNIGVAVFLLLSCLAPLVNPQKWWFISLLGLGFPFLWVVTALFLATWLVIKPRFAFISLVALIIAIPATRVFFAFNTPGAFTYEKKPGSIRIATWNVARFLEMKRNNNKGSQSRLKMLELIKSQDADILCLQEFFHSFDSAWYPNINFIKDNLGYPYWFFSHDNDGDKHFTGSIVFSKFPIIDSGMIRYPRPTLPDALIHADIRVADDTIRMYTTHLQSLQFGKDDYQKLSDLKNANDSLLSNSRNVFSKLRRGIAYRSIQADIIDKVLDDSPYPVLFCADLNDIPNSYTYYTVKGEMQDAFLKKGFGIGRTFAALSPTLRIDYIFADDRFRIEQFNRINKKYSDHYMLVADVTLKK